MGFPGMRVSLHAYPEAYPERLVRTAYYVHSSVNVSHCSLSPVTFRVVVTRTAASGEDYHLMADFTLVFLATGLHW